MSKKDTMKLTFDLNDPPPLTNQQKARLEALSKISDEQIDTSDAPYQPNATWLKADMRLPASKKQITLRIDPDVLEFFKRGGKRYQSRMNAVLRSYVEAHKIHTE